MSLPYYKRFPRDFLDGTIGMSLEEKGAYAIVLDLIFMRDGRLEDNDQYLAGQLGCSVRKWRTIKDVLVVRGKIAVVEGKISNSRADKLLEETRIFVEKQAENGRKPKQNSHLSKPTFQPNQNQSDSDTDLRDSAFNKALSLKSNRNKPVAHLLPADIAKDRSWNGPTEVWDFVVERRNLSFARQYLGGATWDATPGQEAVVVKSPAAPSILRALRGWRWAVRVQEARAA